jgi:hypothetical protein
MDFDVSGLMKFDNPTVEFKLQSVGGESKFDDIRVFTLVRQRILFRKLAHIPASARGPGSGSSKARCCSRWLT